MHIAGLQKMTLLDYPGKVACTVFLQGCNFRCPFCHNSDLLPGAGQDFMTREEFLSFLESRKGLLDAVCVSGGEPTLQPELEDFLRDIKAMGYHVKLDTNGSRPEILMHLVGEGLVDYVAMDIKNSPDGYAATAGARICLPDIEKSITYLLSGSVDYEFRTTVVAELHKEADFEAITKWLKALCPQGKARRFFLQSYVDRDSVLEGGLHAPSKETLQKYAQILHSAADYVNLRGVD